MLTSFQGKATSAGIALQWQTASEQNTSHFVVERATDAGAHFQPIGQVPGAGTSTQACRYQLLDSAPNQLNYYRLRQVDLDGTATYSPVALVRTEPGKATLAAYPNPATDWLTLTGPVGTVFRILDQNGRQVGSTTVAASQLPRLDVSGLPPGGYIVQDAATGQHTRFVKAGR